MADTMFCGIRVVESPLAAKRVPRRAHKENPRRKAYHARVQKKWNKRFGMWDEPCFYMVTDKVIGQMIVAHPELMPQLRAAIAQGTQP